MSKRDIPWSNPLKVTISAGMDRTFASVFDALDYLENEWPRKRGDRYDRAVLACRRGVNGLASAEVAREAFIAACLESGLPAVTAAPPPLYRRSGHPSWRASDVEPAGRKR
ncbi:DUF982 domain-containing protein [Rhizobium tibeticum]|uniref:DUF982 domain-containing protein n=1 Tax=Rhizobium tibeticum TaxID=501024 RepID=UPI0009311715|nr:DUF982 domain-containing protein [Rhizobium tibeticum]